MSGETVISNQTVVAKSEDLVPEDEVAVAEFRRILTYASGPTAVKKLWDTRLTRTDRGQLGNDFYDATKKHRNAIRMWMFLKKVDYAQAVIEVGEALNWLPSGDVDWLLDAAGYCPRDPERAQVWAIDRGDLVLIRSNREMYWNGEHIDIDWFTQNKAWEFLIIACEHAKSGDPIDVSCFGKSVHKDTVSDRKYRLKEVAGFPSELIDYFKKAGTGTQYFALSNDKIHLF